MAIKDQRRCLGAQMTEMVIPLGGDSHPAIYALPPHALRLGAHKVHASLLDWMTIALDLKRSWKSSQHLLPTGLKFPAVLCASVQYLETALWLDASNGVDLPMPQSQKCNLNH